MHKHRAVVTLALILSAPLAHADLEDQLQSRWQGAWLIVTGELYSDCNGASTENLINGDLVSSRGRRAFAPGELGQVIRVNVRRRSVELTVDLEEGVLIEYQDGPFTLYREASCRVELAFDFGDQRTRDLSVPAVESQFASWFERHARLTDAERSPSWNERERRDYPDDYEQTLAEYRLWKVDEHNRLVDERVADSVDQTRQLLGQVSADASYGAAFVRGVSAMRQKIGDDCGRLLASNADTFGTAYEAPTDVEALGYEHGQQLAYFIELNRRLEGCYMAPHDLVAVTSVSAR